MYTISEAAEVLRIAPAQLARWVGRGRIPTAVLVDGPSGKVWRLPRETVDTVAKQLRRAEQATPIASKAVPTTESKPAKTPEKRHNPPVRWAQVEKIVQRERAHWQRLSELQADTISSLRHQLEDAQNELEHLRERIAENEEGKLEDEILGRNTLPLGRTELVEMSFPQLEMP